MAMISNDWLPALKDEFRKPYYAKLFSFVKEEYATHVVFYAASRGEGRDFGTGPLS